MLMAFATVAKRTKRRGGIRRWMRGERHRGRGGGWAKGGRDLQTNLITSRQNGITLLALELLTSQKESEREGERDIEKRGWGWGGEMLYERTGGNLKRVTSISATAVIRVFGLHLNTWVKRREKVREERRS